jgi:hypothetical protein
MLSGRRRTSSSLGLAAITVVLASAPARAAGSKYSAYEREAIHRVLARDHGRIDPHPEGKIIERIDVVPLGVFDETDPVPDFFNVFHVTTRKRVVRRELLFDTGQPYDRDRVEESARNLRDLRQLSLVLIVAVAGSRPDRVRVVVITKDVWSLRLNTDFGVSNGTLDYLVLQPSEINWFGTHNSVSGLFVLKPDTFSLGGAFDDPRIAGSRIEGSFGGNVIVNRDTGRPEGSFGSFYYGQPLYSLEAKWAWDTTILWRTEVTRLFVGGNERTYDAAATPADDAIPYEYKSDLWYGDYELTRSFGHGLKQDLSVGMEAYRRRFHATDLSRFDPRAAREFTGTQVPVSDTRISPYVQLHAHTSRFLRVHDFNTLGLEEDYSLGHDILARVYPASRALGSSRTLLGTYLSASYTAPLGDGLVRVLGSSQVELAAHGGTDALFKAKTRVVSPSLGPGRLVYDAVLADHEKNYLRQRFTLGGNTRLRGYPIDSFLGQDLVAGSLEFRTRAAELLSAQLGGVLFYDTGDAFDGFSNLRPKQDAGLGIRMLFPQADRIVFRADWGFPLTRGYRTFPGAAYFTFGQAFPMPGVTPPNVTTTDLTK